jgi:ParB-like chromosome segregation protein Spo0J
MNIQKVKITAIKSNPNNPRLIKDDKFHKLVQSIKEFPQMLELRPIVVNDEMVILGGNMRHKACIQAGLKEITIVKASELTEEQQKEFIIKDNVGFGEWDWDVLANEWNAENLEEWGLDLPILMNEPSLDELIGEEKNKPATMKITFDSAEQLQKAEIDIQELLDRKYQGAYFSVSAGEI